jgi:ketosteroid isomerase-like protein
VRLSIAPAQGGVARLVRFQSSPAGATLTVRRFTGHNRNGWVLWGAEQAVALPLEEPRRAALERFARAALSAAVLGGESASVDGVRCTDGDFAWVEISDPGRTVSVERRCATTGATGALIRALSEAAGSRDEEELYASGVAEVLAADRAFARAVRESSLAAAMASYARDDAAIVPGAAAAVRGRDAIGLHFADVAPFDWTPAGAEVSARGDMGWSWGRWTRGDASGDYLAVWRRDGDGAWRYAARTVP